MFKTAIVFVMSFMMTTPIIDLNNFAERYVKLALALGELDKDYVDAYYGPPEWREEVKKSPKTLDQIASESSELAKAFKDVDSSRLNPLEQRRLKFTSRQLAALLARIQILEKQKMTFDEESQALYDAVAPNIRKKIFSLFSTKSINSSQEPATSSLATKHSSKAS